MGVYTVTTFQEAKRLETIALQPNDIVVFYGGITDAISIPQTAYNRRDLEMSTSFPNWLRDHFHFFTVYLLTQPAYKIPEVLTNDKLLDQEVATATSQYQAALLEARHYTEAKGAHFVSALQPQLWSYPLSQEEQKAEAFPGNTTFGFRIAVVRSWPAFAKVTDCDLTHSLDWLRALHFPVYFDHAHTNEYGNNLVALSILDCPALVTSIIKQAQLLF